MLLGKRHGMFQFVSLVEYALNVLAFSLQKHNHTACNHRSCSFNTECEKGKAGIF